MPELSRFLGIVISMFYRDHSPPHFHAYYAEHEIAVSIREGKILWDSFPKSRWLTSKNGARHTEQNSRKTGSARAPGNP